MSRTRPCHSFCDVLQLYDTTQGGCRGTYRARYNSIMPSFTLPTAHASFILRSLHGGHRLATSNGSVCEVLLVKFCLVMDVAKTSYAYPLLTVSECIKVLILAKSTIHSKLDAVTCGRVVKDAPLMPMLRLTACRLSYVYA